MSDSTRGLVCRVIGLNLILGAAQIALGQPAPALHPAGSYPGDWLQFRGDRKLTGRSRLVGNITPPLVGSANAVSPHRETLPVLTYSSVVVNLNTSSFVNSNGQTITNQAAIVAFQDIATSEGANYKKFGFYLVRAIGDSKVFLQFRPTVDPNLAGINGFFQDVSWVYDTANHSVSTPVLAGLPIPLQHLLLSIVADLSKIYTQPTQVVLQPNSAGLPLWDIKDAASVAGALSDSVFRPSPILWTHFIGARQSAVALQVNGAASRTLDLPAVNANAGALAANSTWSIGPATFDLNHNGNTQGFPINYRSKVGNFIAGSALFQKVEFGSAFDSCGNNASTCYEFGHLYQWQNNNWVEQWKTQGIPALFESNTIVGDFDNDGRLEIAVEPWYDLQVYDLLTGALKSSARFTPDKAESGRGYGWLGAFDLNADGTREFVALGTFQNMISVLGWREGKLVRLWDHLIEASTSARQTTHDPGAAPVQDIDGDGRPEIVTSIFNETGDGEWHVVAREGYTGNVILDQPHRYLVGMADINRDGAAELFTIATDGLLTPEYGQIDVVSFRSRTAQTLLELNATGLSTVLVESLPLNVNSGDQMRTLLAGPIVQGGLPVFFTRRLVDTTSGSTELTAWQWQKDALAAVGTITGPNLQVTATRPAPAGSPGFLITASARGNSPATLTTTGLGATLVQSTLVAAPLSSPVVAHLRPTDPPTVIVQNALEELVAFQPSSATGTATVSWTHPGRGGSLGSYSYNGQYGFANPLLASLTGDGTLQTIAATRGDSGQARIVAIQPDGSDLWISDLNRFPGAPPAWGQAGATMLFAGRLRDSSHEDVVAGTRRGAQGSEELNLLDGFTGTPIWTDPYGNTPGTSTNQRGAGQGWLAVYDWNHDGLDELVNLMTDVFWVKDGADHNLIDRNSNPRDPAGTMFPNGWAFYGVPAVADFLNNGSETILYGASTYIFGLLDANGSSIWHGDYLSGTPGYLQGIADLDGTGTLSLVSAGTAAPNGQSTLSVQRSDTGERLWSLPLPGCGIFAAGGYALNNAPSPVTVGDIDGDGRDEAIFACSSKLYVVGADPGNTSGKILWSLDLGTFLGTPILADPEGAGRAQILVVGANGYVYGVGSFPSDANPSPQAPVIAADGVVDGLTSVPSQLTQAGTFSIAGTNLSDGAYQADSARLPTQLGGTVVTVNGQLSRLSSAEAGQVKAALPPDLPLGTASIVVRTRAGLSKPALVHIVPPPPPQ